MSPRTPNRRNSRARAEVFAALGDPTRLALIAKLARGRPRSISQLTKGSRVTRQAVTKHLHVLQRAGLVRSAQAGRESLFELDLAPVDQMKSYLDGISAQWDDALSRLKHFVER